MNEFYNEVSQTTNQKLSNMQRRKKMNDKRTTEPNPENPRRVFQFMPSLKHAIELETLALETSMSANTILNNLVSYALDHVYVAEETVKALHYTNDPEE